YHHLVAYFERVGRERKSLGSRAYDDLDLVERPNSFSFASAIEADIDLERMLSTLEPRKRSVLTRALAGETTREIAVALGLAEGNVRQLSFRAIRELRKTFGINLKAEISRHKP